MLAAGRAEYVFQNYKKHGADRLVPATWSVDPFSIDPRDGLTRRDRAGLLHARARTAAMRGTSTCKQTATS